ncbi:MAG TPA: ferrochelatase [Blastocatellia bacterium]|nr:ferrochelatase [Blastocatellia bacterium]
MSNQRGERLGVLLFNLGGPETLADVRPFLFNLFADPDIIRLPLRSMQKPLAWAISTQRYRKSQSYYRQIGGGSPLRRITDQQAHALELALAARGITGRVYVGMRYWWPMIEQALEQISSDQITHLVVLPLYPQYSISTTGSSLNRMNQLFGQNGKPPAVSVIESWQAEPAYIDALCRTIKEELDQFPTSDPAATHIVFSAHSVPVSYIEEGDPYLKQTQETVSETVARLGRDRPHSLSFQSKVGPVKWLRPSTDETIRRLAAEGVDQVLLVPVSFVSEHIETLYELDILYRGVAEEVGLKHYRRAPALNCRPDFIEALAGLVERNLEG